MRRIAIAAAALCLATPALAGSYRIVLDRPESGKLLTGHAGVQAADDRTDVALVRVISPGNAVDKRGTVRVLVMNLSDKPFKFGPSDVTLTLDDGTIFKPTSMELMDDGRALIERESKRAATIEMANNGRYSSLAGEYGAPTASRAPSATSIASARPLDSASQDFTADDQLMPGASALAALDQLLVPLDVEPQKAWGGYYVFDVPEDVQGRRADQQMSIVVRTGHELHRFSATLHWK